MAEDDPRFLDIQVVTAIVALTSALIALGREVSDLKYSVFNQRITPEEFEKVQERQKEFFAKMDEVIELLNKLQEKFKLRGES
jgi:SMC interacting uncharacterized protein involved in chromosome segregation